MKIIIVLSAIFLVNMSFSQTKRAFIVGIGNYKEAGEGWWSIHGHNDAKLMYDYLKENGGFNSNNIKIITQDSATYDNVTTQLNEFISQLNGGDKVIFFFSGHGQQVSDVDGDEKNEDQKDEALVMWDTPLKLTDKNKNYRLEKHLTDDSLSVFFTEIRNKVGVNGELVVLLDACFSGDANRLDDSPEKIKGSMDALLIEGYPKGLENDEKNADRVREFNVTGDELSPFIMMTAVESGVLAQENMHDEIILGDFTYSLINVLSKEGHLNLNYSNLYDLTFSEYKNHSYNTPWVLINDDIENKVFFIKQKKYKYPHNEEYHLTHFFPKRNKKISHFRKNIGRFHGFDKNTYFKIVSRYSGNELGFARIYGANHFNAVFALNEPILADSLNSSVFIPIKLGIIDADGFKILTDKKSLKKLDEKLPKILKIENFSNIFHTELVDYNYSFKIYKKQYVLYKNDLEIFRGYNIEDLYNTLIKESFYNFLQNEITNNSKSNEFSLLYDEEDNGFCFLNKQTYKLYFNVFSYDDNHIRVHIPNGKLYYQDTRAEETLKSRKFQFDSSQVLSDVVIIGFKDVERNFSFNLNKNIFSSDLSIDYNDLEVNHIKDDNYNCKSDPKYKILKLDNCEQLHCISLGECD